MKFNRNMIKENRMKQARDMSELPVVVKIMIDVDGRNKVIKTINMQGPGSSARDVVENARMELDIFKETNPELSNLVKAEVTFKMVI